MKWIFDEKSVLDPSDLSILSIIFVSYDLFISFNSSLIKMLFSVMIVNHLRSFIYDGMNI